MTTSNETQAAHGSLTAQVRQGDVALHPIDAVPEGARPIARSTGRIVLAEGEATGQPTPSARPLATLLADGDDRYLPVTTPVALVNEEHAAIGIVQGTYRVVVPRVCPARSLPVRLPPGGRLIGRRKRPDGAALLRRTEAWSNKWRDRAGSSEPADRARAEAGIVSLYAADGRPAPAFAWVPSPAAGDTAYAFTALGPAGIVSAWAKGDIGNGANHHFNASPVPSA